MGFAALAVPGARMRPGIDLVLELAGFADLLRGADLVVTGEGCLDEQTLAGKAPAGVAAAAAAAGVPAVAVAVRCTLDCDDSSATTSARPTRSPTSNPTRAAAPPMPAHCWSGSPR